MRYSVTVKLSEAEQTINSYKNKGYEYLNITRDEFDSEKVVIFFNKYDFSQESKLSIANNKLEDYIKQQEENELLSDFGKSLACNVIKQCQKVMNDTFEMR